MNPLFSTLPTSVFEHMSGLARAHGAVNLGQGFPDFGWPEEILAEAARAVRDESNQYPPMRGLPELREAVAGHYRRFYGIETAAEQVIVTSGATEALAASLMTLISPGDEVVLFQPLYDAYLPLVLRAGGKPRFIRLEPPEWRITSRAVADAFSGGARFVVLNNPHNPTGRMFAEDELHILADACIANNAIVVSDEVWEHVIFDDRRHIPISTLPGMAERTVKIGSAGKIFALTGWKVGWTFSSPALAETVARAHQFLTFATAPNLQRAVAFGLNELDASIGRSREAYQAARDTLKEGLGRAGYAVLPADGTYFINIDLAASGIDVDDVTFCERAVREAGVAAVPVSALYAEDHVRSVVRLCFAKAPETLAAGIERLGEARRLFD